MSNRIIKADLGNLSQRLKFLMDTAGVKQVHLASKLGVTPQAINHLCNSNAKSSKHTKEIARLLNANEKWLAFGDGGPFEEKPDKAKQTSQTVPVFFLDQLKKIKLQADIYKLNPVEYHWSSESTDEAFGVYVNDNNLAPRFEQGDIVVLKPSHDVKNGALALVYSNELNKLLFCYLYINATKNLICGFVPQDSLGIFLITSEDIIYGIFQESFKKAQG
ncbi:MAG: transcriptional regulator, family [Gammaproteobacteria bacterium]|nr:transcriptional regulator, family [Gammaproteobacteria bacterium]